MCEGELAFGSSSCIRVCCCPETVSTLQFPGGKAAVCEGELKSFGAKFIKAKGKRVAVFKKGGCLGTSSLIGLNTSDEESAQGLQWPASLPQVWPSPHMLPLPPTTHKDVGYPSRAL